MQAAGKMLMQVLEEPWATVRADFVGPLPRSKHGNQMLLVLIDRFPKWAELVPLRSATAESLKRAFRYNGIQFASRIFKNFLDDWVPSSIHPARESDGASK